MDVYSSSVSDFVKVDGLDDTFTKVGPSSYLGILSSFEEKGYATNMVIVLSPFTNAFSPSWVFVFPSLLLI